MDYAIVSLFERTHRAESNDTKINKIWHNYTWIWLFVFTLTGRKFFRCGGSRNVGGPAFPS